MAAKKATKKPAPKPRTPATAPEDERCLFLTRLISKFEEPAKFPIYSGVLGNLSAVLFLDFGPPALSNEVDLNIEYEAERPKDQGGPQRFGSLASAIAHLGGDVGKGTTFVASASVLDSDLFDGLKRPLSGPWHVLQINHDEKAAPGVNLFIQQIAVFCTREDAELYVLAENE